MLWCILIFNLLPALDISNDKLQNQNTKHKLHVYEWLITNSSLREFIGFVH